MKQVINTTIIIFFMSLLSNNDSFSIGIHSQTANEYLPHLDTSKEESITCYHFAYFHLPSPPNTDTILNFVLILM